MAVVIAFRSRPACADNAEAAGAPPSSDADALRPSPVGDDVKRGQLIIFPGIDFAKLLPSFGAGRQATTRTHDLPYSTAPALPGDIPGVSGDIPGV